MKFKYDKTHNILRYENWAGGFTAKPIYMIPCRCGAPVKAFFNGRPPLNKKDMDICGFGDMHARSTFRLITHAKIAWGFWLKYPCPVCNRENYIYRDEETALTNFIKEKLRINNTEIDASRVKLLLSRIKQAPVAQEFFSFQSDILSGRPDATLTVNDTLRNCIRFNDLLKGLKITYKDEGYWTDGANKIISHHELESDVLKAHNEECTCSLCME